MPYVSPVSEISFILEHVAGFASLRDTERFAEATPDLTEAVLTEAGRFCDGVMAPLNRQGDLTPARLENGVVRVSPGFEEAYHAMVEGGWIGVSSSAEFGGMGLPFAMATAINDMMTGACMALQLNPLLTQGQIEALEAHASDAIKDVYLPKLVSGEWSGTMNLTEPQAGSDVGALRTKAEPQDDGTYKITGQKIYITWGDHEMASNISHLVLARLPDAVPGTKGISLFIVPKFIPDENGEPGQRNSLRVVSLEHKLGIHGSPTAVMEYDGATGWLVGEPNGGMAAMFTMMNNARIGTASQGAGIAEAAFQHAAAYARERKQGRAGGTGAIIEHADVRRMLTAMKADTFVARSVVLSAAVAVDMAKATGDADWSARAALLTPIAKGFATDTGIAVANEGIQIHGGMGYVEETGAAQFLRDARITSIYEGTNGIQAMDLVARKMMDGGEAAYRLLDEVEALAEEARGRHPQLAEAVWGAAETLREATEWLVSADLEDRFPGAVPYAKAFARVLGGHFHLKAAMTEDAPGPRTALAQFYVTRLLPEHGALLSQARIGSAGLFDLTVEDLVA
ncbi:acyl-CoA dehydrogenase [Alphaproteobacteria bacterium GH1-50]|uniref:3-methylmercaptopropionyl-CoA dehydrogenase n=1 Tax=Kangsaoukella pontilimi TaxID=2691042 RepID=A0A7C9N2X5_9RHOB|nr:acyl-CoA dehydrogenase [Kangsaoukella pontilimi]MXQ09598.1 acyl-CoA dehydrogenase [Kangsaoukella pontilimi]